MFNRPPQDKEPLGKSLREAETDPEGSPRAVPAQLRAGPTKNATGQEPTGAMSSRGLVGKPWPSGTQRVDAHDSPRARHRLPVPEVTPRD